VVLRTALLRTASQSDFFARVCPNCKGEGKRLVSFAVRQSPGIRLIILPQHTELKVGDLPILPPRRPSALWNQFRLVYRQGKARGTRQDDFEYTPCSRCRGTGHLSREGERVYRRWLTWRGIPCR
jgi:hypothetical protein